MLQTEQWFTNKYQGKQIQEKKDTSYRGEKGNFCRRIGDGRGAVCVPDIEKLEEGRSRVTEKVFFPFFLEYISVFKSVFLAYISVSFANIAFWDRLWKGLVVLPASQL